jgi:carboxypeptidase T
MQGFKPAPTLKYAFIRGVNLLRFDPGKQKMKKIYLAFLINLTCIILSAQAYQSARAKIYTSSDGISKLAALGIDMDHISITREYIISDFTMSEISLARNAGFRVDILIPDVNKWYAAQSPSQAARITGGICKPRYTDIKDPVNFHQGSFAGYLSLDEMEKTLDSMRIRFPNLVSVKKEIDTTKTWEHRTIWYIKVSDNPDSNEAEPQMLYTAMHHAREPGSMMQLIYYIWYLLENYNSDPKIKTLVDGMEMYFVPCVNPDGYEYNRLTDPNGGGMWRKNRRNNNDGTFGVDLNRNYGHRWGADNVGSSPVTTSQTYRGPSAFSEPETRAVRNFCNRHAFRSCLNYHTFANVLIYPDIGATDPADSATFIQIARHITTEDNYTNGTCLDVLFYTTNGDADDWMYGEKNSKPKIFSLTPEVGDVDNGFWPPASMIPFNCRANLSQNIRMAQMILNYGTVNDESENLVTGSLFALPLSIQRMGMDSIAPISVKIMPLSANITVGTGSKTYSLKYLETTTDTFQLHFIPGIQRNEEVKFVISTGNGLYIQNDTITKYYGPVDTLFNDHANDLLNWNSDWGLENLAYHSPPTSFTESPFGPYQRFDYLDHTFKNTVDLTNVFHATLSFWARWDIQTNYDEVELMVWDDGSTQTPLCGKYTAYRPVSMSEVYQGQIPEWKKEIISLDDFIGKKIRLDFLFTSDNNIEHNGFNLDDILLTAIAKPGAGIAYPPAANNIRISPNPAREFIQIDFGDTVYSKVIITDIAGKEILSLPCSGKSLTVPVNCFENGIYFLHFISDQGTRVIKAEVLH